MAARRPSRTRNRRVMLPQVVVDNGPPPPPPEENMIGTIVIWPTEVMPANWLLCDGSSLLRAGTYADLFAVIGTYFGSVDGTHFNLPSTDTKYIAGAGVVAFPGDQFGENSITLAESQLPPHAHDVQYNNIANKFGALAGTVVTAVQHGGAVTAASEETGAGDVIDKRPLSIALSYIIRFAEE